jgi:hypothetical protein
MLNLHSIRDHVRAVIMNSVSVHPKVEWLQGNPAPTMKLMSTAVPVAPPAAGSERSRLHEYGALVCALIVYIAGSGLLAHACLRAAGGHFVYALDDSYIGMAMARSLAQHGVWGITRFGFTSSSSSPLFTLLLAAAYRITGIHEITPVILSSGFGALAVFLADRYAARFLAFGPRTVVLAAFVLLTPLIEIGLLGMEHTLHLCLVLGFLILFEEAGSSPRRLAAVTALMVATRYEGLFLVAAAALLLMHDRRWRALAWMLAGAALAVVAYGIFSVAHGAWFLPNSVALKGSVPHGGSAIFALVRRFVHAPTVSVPMLALAVAAVGLWRSRPQCARFAFLIAIAGFLHLTSAGIGSAWRYEAYLAGTAALAIGFAFPSSRCFARGTWYTFLIVSVFAISLLYGRASAAIGELPHYSRAIDSQQWQMARFLETYFPTSSVAANDIGAISFLTDIHCIDLVGLADTDIFRAKRSHRYTTEFLAQEADDRGVQIAIVYDSWFNGKTGFYTDGPAIPKQWIRVAQLQVPYSTNLGDEVVSLYAVEPSMAAPLRTALVQFQPGLPGIDRLTILP